MSALLLLLGLAVGHETLLAADYLPFIAVGV
jgi:hypothetical protein